MWFPGSPNARDPHTIDLDLSPPPLRNHGPGAPGHCDDTLRLTCEFVPAEGLPTSLSLADSWTLRHVSGPIRRLPLERWLIQGPDPTSPFNARGGLLSTKCHILSRFPYPIAFARVVFYARCMELLTHDELVRLTPSERLALISQLWDSLEEDDLPLTAARRAELDRRLATLEQDRREGITWATLKAELEQRCP